MLGRLESVYIKKNTRDPEQWDVEFYFTKEVPFLVLGASHRGPEDALKRALLTMLEIHGLAPDSTICPDF